MSVPLRRLLGITLLAVMATALMAACGSDPTPTPSPTPTATPQDSGPTPTPDEAAAFEQEWADLIAAAQEEGELVTFICCGLGRSLSEEIIPHFEETFDIRWTNSTGSSRQQADKIVPEREAGVYGLDVWIGGVGTNLQLIEADVLDPIEELFIHPEVTDLSAWYGGAYAWGDPDEITMAFVGDVSMDISYNTDLVTDPSVIQSYWDFLEPEWRGKFVMRDPREVGTSGTYTFYYRNSQLGPEFLRRLITETEADIAGDARQAAEWLAQGRYHFCHFTCTTEVEELEAEGAPVTTTFPHIPAEGARLSEGGNALYRVNRPPNPNAQKLFINWFLSREGQYMMQEATGSDSLRLDIDKDNVDPVNLREPGLEYTFELLEPGYTEDLEEAGEFVRQVMNEAGL